MPLYKDIVRKISVSPAKKTKQKDYCEKGLLAIIDQGRHLIGGYINDISKAVPCELPVIVFGDHTRAVKYVPFPFGAGADGIKVLQPNPGISPKFLYYVTQYLVLKMEDKGYARHYQYLEKKEVDLPPLPEQERIVARIEELFSQLDNGVETLKKTKQQLAVYRQAVLKEAFGGISQSIKVSAICSVVRGGSPRPAGDEKYYNGDIPFLKVADITNSKGMYLKKATYSIKEAGLSKTRRVPENTLMLSNSGATLGIPKICTFSTTFNDGIAAFIDFKRNEYLPFHYYFWLSKTTELRAINQGAAQPNLNTTIIGDTLMPDLDFERELEVAQWIEARLSVCDSIEQTIDTALQQAEALRQSILKRAFEGGEFNDGV